MLLMADVKSVPMELWRQVQELYLDAEIALRGLIDMRRDAQTALANGDYAQARVLAKAMLERAPQSRIALAILADAAEGSELWAEWEATATTLAQSTALRVSQWLQLADVRAKLGCPKDKVRAALLEAIDAAGHRKQDAVAARIAMADFAMNEGAFDEAKSWLAKYPDDPDVIAQRVKLALACNDLQLDTLASLFRPQVLDANEQWLFGRMHLRLFNIEPALVALCRAIILDAPGAMGDLREALIQWPAANRDSKLVARVKVLFASDPTTLALLEGNFGELAQRVVDGTLEWPPSLVASLAYAAQNRPLLAKHSPLRELDSLIVNLPVNVDAIEVWLQKAASTAWTNTREQGWLAKAIGDVVAMAIRGDGALDWDLLLRRSTAWLTELARHNPQRAMEIAKAWEHVARVRGEPVRIAVVGEFNAGKSTFVNALIGQDIAPVGVLPTTAVAHTFSFGIDPVARIFATSGDRTVSPEQMRAIAKEMGTNLKSVSIEMPLPLLHRVEIVDTPGFNDPDEGRRTKANEALETIDLALWLLDATSLGKKSEWQVLKELTAKGIAVVAVINKIDRLEACQRAEIEKFATEILSDIERVRAPFFVSAQDAVRARQGDPAASADAGNIKAIEAWIHDEVAMEPGKYKQVSMRRECLLAVREVRTEFVTIAANTDKGVRQLRAKGDERARKWREFWADEAKVNALKTQLKDVYESERTTMEGIANRQAVADVWVARVRRKVIGALIGLAKSLNEQASLAAIESAVDAFMSAIEWSEKTAWAAAIDRWVDGWMHEHLEPAAASSEPRPPYEDGMHAYRRTLELAAWQNKLARFRVNP